MARGDVFREAKATTRAFMHRVCPQEDRSNDAYHPDRTKLQFSFHNGRVGWAEKRGVCHVVWRMVVAAEVQALTDGPKATSVTPKSIKGSLFSPLSLHHSLFLPTTTITLVLSHALR